MIARAFVEHPVIAFKPTARTRARLTHKNWKPRLFIRYLKLFGCGKGAAILAAVLLRIAAPLTHRRPLSRPDDEPH